MDENIFGISGEPVEIDETPEVEDNTEDVEVEEVETPDTDTEDNSEGEEDSTKSEGTTEDTEPKSDNDFNAFFEEFKKFVANGQNPNAPQTEEQTENPYIMTPDLARYIYEQEAQVDPAKAWENYIDNLSTAKMQDFQQMYGPLLNEQKLKAEVDKVATKYADFKEYEPELKDYILNEIDKEYQGNDRLSDKAAFELAYLRKKTESLEKKLKEAFENGQKAASKVNKTKKSIHNEKGNKPNELETDSPPPGIKIIGMSDGIFL